MALPSEAIEAPMGDPTQEADAPKDVGSDLPAPATAPTQVDASQKPDDPNDAKKADASGLEDAKKTSESEIGDSDSEEAPVEAEKGENNQAEYHCTIGAFL